MEKKRDPWTDPDPQPGDFDEHLAEIDPQEIQVVPAGTTRGVYIGNEDPKEWVKRNRAEREKAARNGAKQNRAASNRR